jgi:hypothetical protein
MKTKMLSEIVKGDRLVTFDRHGNPLPSQEVVSVNGEVVWLEMSTLLALPEVPIEVEP